MGKPVVHFEITGTDTKSLSEFYTNLFDWKVDIMPMEQTTYGMVDTGQEGKITGGLAGSDDPNAHGVVIYIEVDDPQAYLDKAESLGGKTIIPVQVIPDMVTFAQFVDPQGNRIGLVKNAA